jgi:hypothetical protein
VVEWSGKRCSGKWRSFWYQKRCGRLRIDSTSGNIDNVKKKVAVAIFILCHCDGVAVGGWQWLSGVAKDAAENGGHFGTKSVIPGWVLMARVAH